MRIIQIAALGRELNATIIEGEKETLCPIVGIALTEKGDVRGLIVTPEGKIELLDKGKKSLEDDNPFINKPLKIVDYDDVHEKAMEEQEIRLGIKKKPRPSHIMSDPAELGERDPDWD